MTKPPSKINELLESIRHTHNKPLQPLTGTCERYYGPPPPKVQCQQQLAVEKHDAEDRKQIQKEFDRLMEERPFYPHDVWWIYGCGSEMEEYEINEFGSFITPTVPTPQVAAAFKKRFDSLKYGDRIGTPGDAFVAWLHPEFVTKHCVARNGVLYAS